jgi:hypothetical protein
MILEDERAAPSPAESAEQMWKNWRAKRYNGYDLLAAGVTLELAYRMDAEVVEFAEAYAASETARLRLAEQKLAEFNVEWDGEKYVYNGKD